MSVNFHYTIQTQKSFDVAVEAIVSETAKIGFRVLHIHDVQATLKNNGFESDKLKVIEVCNAKYANALLQKDLRMSIFIPCRMSVYVRDGNTYISTMNVNIVPSIVPELDLHDLAEQVNALLVKIIDNSK